MALTHRRYPQIETENVNTEPDTRCCRRSIESDILCIAGKTFSSERNRTTVRMARKKITETLKRSAPSKKAKAEEQKPEPSASDSSDDAVLRKVVKDVNKKARRRSNNGGTSAPMTFNVSDDDSDSSQPTEPEKKAKQDASKSPRPKRASSTVPATPKKRRISASPAKATPAKTQQEGSDSGGEKEDEDDNESNAASNEESPKKKPFYEGPKLYEVEKVVGHEGEGRNRYFQIRWKGYPPEDDTWEPIAKLSCPRLIAEYYEQVIFPRSYASNQTVNIRISPLESGCGARPKAANSEEVEKEEEGAACDRAKAQDRRAGQLRFR